MMIGEDEVEERRGEVVSLPLMCALKGVCVPVVSEAGKCVHHFSPHLLCVVLCISPSLSVPLPSFLLSLLLSFPLPLFSS